MTTRRINPAGRGQGELPYPECGPEWVAFALFRDDWPKPDLEFWARKAYVAAPELNA